MAYEEEEVLTADILAKPAPGYRRPHYINTLAKPNTCYYIDQLEGIRKALDNVGGNALVDRFREGPFGHFIGWNPKRSYGGVLNSLLSRAIHSKHGLWFHIGGHNIEYSHRDHALITGLKFGPTPFDPCRRRNPRHSRVWQVVCGGANESANTLLQMLSQNPSPFVDPDGDIHLRLAHILIANNFLLGHDARKPPYSWLWFLADDMHTFIEFPWGAYTHKTLRYYVRTFGGTDTKYHFHGPAWALIVWGFEIIRGLGHVAWMLVAGHLYPRVLRWHYRLSLRRTTDEELYALFDEIQYLLENVSVEPREVETRWYRSVDVEGSYSVSTKS